MKRITFEQYLIRRGYSLKMGNLHFFKRLFIDSLCQPGFYRFWRVWNPVYGYFLFLLYKKLGGNRNKIFSTIIVFLFCGFVLHDLPISLISGNFTIATLFAFLFYAIITIATFYKGELFNFERFTRSKNFIINISFLAAGILFGLLANRMILNSI